MSAVSKFVKPQVPPVALDDMDIRLLRVLSQDSRLSQRAISREVELSAPAVAERIARLERLGVIKGYTLDIDWAAVGYPMVVHLSLTVAPGAGLAGVVDGLRTIPELVSAHIVTGQWDVFAQFRLRDHSGLQELLLGRIWQIPGVQKVETFLELASVDGQSNLDTPDS